MEAKRKALPTDEDKDWVTGLPSKDSMLKRVLTDWKRKLEDGYQQIGRACLLFRELAEKFYHPALAEDMKCTAAIYRYILVPLHQLSPRDTAALLYSSIAFQGHPRVPRLHTFVRRTRVGVPGWFYSTTPSQTQIGITLSE